MWLPYHWELHQADISQNTPSPNSVEGVVHVSLTKFELG
jgi:hypothetical protein